MDLVRKFTAEAIGTMTLVLIGCGTAMLVGCDAANGSGYLLTALAFGLVIVGMAYCIGNVSGCHINPAVSLACLISGRMTAKEFGIYCGAQVLGAFVGTGFLGMIFGIGGIEDKTGGFGSNGLAGVNGVHTTGIIVEFLLTFIFVLVILGVTDAKANHGSFGGVVIGFSLVLVHIFGIGLTGTSVNPARSIAPAVYAAAAGNMEPIKCLWIFIVAPFVGAAAAAMVYKVISPEKK